MDILLFLWDRVYLTGEYDPKRPLGYAEWKLPPRDLSPRWMRRSGTVCMEGQAWGQGPRSRKGKTGGLYEMPCGKTSLEWFCNVLWACERQSVFKITPCFQAEKWWLTNSDQKINYVQSVCPKRRKKTKSQLASSTMYTDLKGEKPLSLHRDTLCCSS